MLMLPSVHVTRVLFIVLAGNSALTMGFYWSYTLLLQSPVLMRSCIIYKPYQHDHFVVIQFQMAQGTNAHYLLCVQVYTIKMSKGKGGEVASSHLNSPRIQTCRDCRIKLSNDRNGKGQPIVGFVWRSRVSGHYWLQLGWLHVFKQWARTTSVTLPLLFAIVYSKPAAKHCVLPSFSNLT